MGDMLFFEPDELELLLEEEDLELEGEGLELPPPLRSVAKVLAAWLRWAGEVPLLARVFAALDFDVLCSDLLGIWFSLLA